MQSANTSKRRKNGRVKILYALLAAVLAAAIIAGGTLAYQNLYQKAMNEFSGTVANGTRLHDDYVGPILNQEHNQKDVYVENFGTTPLIVRVRLDEYYELGGNPVVSGTLESDTETWIPRVHNIPSAASPDWGFVMGGTKFYLPTENLDDVEGGTWTGPDADLADNILGRLYYTKETGMTNLQTPSYVSGDQAGTAITSLDPFTAADQGYTDNIFDTEAEGANPQHFAQKGNKATLDATIMTMAEWYAAGNPTGEFWIADVDGWYYWGQYLDPDTATGLLLHQVDRLRDPYDDYYYAINVVMQSATLSEAYMFGDTGAFGGGGMTTDSKRLINYIDDTLAYGVSAKSMSSVDTTFFDAAGVEWRVLDVNPTTREALILREKCYTITANIPGLGAAVPAGVAYGGAFGAGTIWNATGSYLGITAAAGNFWPTSVGPPIGVPLATPAAPFDVDFKGYGPNAGMSQYMRDFQISAIQHDLVSYTGIADTGVPNVFPLTNVNKLFVLSYFDMFGDQNRTAEATTTVGGGWLRGAPYFATDADRIAKIMGAYNVNDNGPGAYWTRSSSLSTAGQNAAINIDGTWITMASTPVAPFVNLVFIRPALFLNLSVFEPVLPNE